MKKYLLFNCLLIFSLFLNGIITPLHASHLMGADIQWKSLGGDTFLITVKMYRDCRGVSLDSQTLNIEGDSCTNPPKFTVKPFFHRVRDVTSRCNNVTPPCSPVNTKIVT